MVDFTHILQGYFTGTGAIIWLPQCKWSNPEEYGLKGSHELTKIWLRNHNKTKQNKTRCIFYGIYYTQDNNKDTQS